MNKKEKQSLKLLQLQMKYARRIEIESPMEIIKPIVGLELCSFDVLTKEGHAKEGYIKVSEPWCAAEEIYMDFQGKEMRIYLTEDGKIGVYTD